MSSSQEPGDNAVVQQVNMTTFEYTARDDPRRTRDGTTEAESASPPAQRLRTQGLYPIRVEARTREGHRLGRPVTQWKLGKVGLATLGELTDQLADLLEAGVPLEGRCGCRGNTCPGLF